MGLSVRQQTRMGAHRRRFVGAMLGFMAGEPDCQGWGGPQFVGHCLICLYDSVVRVENHNRVGDGIKGPLPLFFGKEDLFLGPLTVGDLSVQGAIRLLEFHGPLLHADFILRFPEGLFGTLALGDIVHHTNRPDHAARFVSDMMTFLMNVPDFTCRFAHDSVFYLVPYLSLLSATRNMRR